MKRVSRFTMLFFCLFYSTLSKGYKYLDYIIWPRRPMKVNRQSSKTLDKWIADLYLKSFFSENHRQKVWMDLIKMGTAKTSDSDPASRPKSGRAPSHHHRIRASPRQAACSICRVLSLTPIEIWIRKIWKGNVVMYGVWTLLCGWWAASDGPPLWLCD